MIICSKCGKENQDRFKFCLGCGAQLSAPEPAAFGPEATPPPIDTDFTPVSPTPPAGLPKINTQVPPEMALTEPEQLAQPAPMNAALSPVDPAAGRIPTSQHAATGTVACPQCGSSNPQEFVFCGNCGARLKEAAQKTAGLSASKPAPDPAAQTPRGKLSLIKPDGSEGGVHSMTGPETVIGRGLGALFDNDSYLSPRHAVLTFEGDRLHLEDADSLNGVFVKITQEEKLEDGDIFRIGQELLRYDEVKDPRTLDDGTEVMGSPNPGYSGRLSIIVGPGIDGSAFPLMGEEVVLGRERGDILFSDDGYVSGTHAKIAIRSSGFYLSDLGSSNGTFIKISQPRNLPSGSFVLLGQQLFRVDYR